MSSDSSHGFLGQEFLTWLWYRLETEGGEFDLGGGRIVGVSMDDFIAFAALDDDETEQTLKKGMPTRSSEAAAGLKNGRRLSQAKLIIALGELQWSLTVDGASLGLRSVKLPDDDEEAESAEERSIERAANFLLIQEVVGQIYKEFLKVRLAPRYLKTTAEAQIAWASAR